MKRLSLPFILILFLCLAGKLFAVQNIDTKAIESLIRIGSFTQATKKIDGLIAKNQLSEAEKYALLFRKEQLNRIRLDFSLTEREVQEKLKPYFPALSNKQLQQWEKELKLEMKIIDNKKYYFKNAIGNLFRLDSIANSVKTKKEGKPSNGVPTFLSNYLPPLLDSLRTQNTSFADTKIIQLHYTVTLQADVIPSGETVRCWLPFPCEGHLRQSNIKLQKINAENYILSPPNSLHRTIYCEKVTQKGQPTVFELEFSFDCKAEWYKPNNKMNNSSDTKSEFYKNYTAERPPHIVFSKKIQKLTNDIIGNESNRFKKTQLIYRWIDANIPWCSALEYSTIDSIPEYVLTNRHGDCGMQTLLFMTMARYAGIPCKWQSGWMLHPNEINLHDWCEVYYEGVGWVPLDQSFEEQNSKDSDIKSFYLSGIDGYRLIVNDDFAQALFPAKIHPRSETLDFQRGEMEWRGGNIYFDKWKYQMSATYSKK